MGRHGYCYNDIIEYPQTIFSVNHRKEQSTNKLTKSQNKDKHLSSAHIIKTNHNKESIQQSLYL